MTGSAKRKGDQGEREAASLIHDLLGVPARRKLGAGRLDDEGDLDGVPYTAVQVVSRATDVVAVGVVRKPNEVEVQARRAGATFAATFLRVRGGIWRVVLTPEQWATYWREATSTATADEASYEAGWHDGVEHGYREAQRLASCPMCGRQMTLDEAAS